MGLENVRDPRDLLPEILRPQENVPALAETAYVQRELDDDGLRVLFNVERQKFVIMDTKAPGGPSAAYVMIVQEPNGAFRPLDNRTIETLRKLRHHDLMADELIRNELEREKRATRNRENTAEALAKDFRHIGQVIAPSTGWRDRSLAREAIRREAS